MSNEDIDKETLQAEIGQIKEAMGIHERYPYMTKIWLTEGMIVGVIAIGMQFAFREMIPLYWLGILLVGMIVIEQIAFRRIMQNTEQPSTGSKPSMNVLILALVLGMFALVFGLDPLIDHSVVDETVMSAVLFTALVGILYLAIGNMLTAYSIRKHDRYAIYIGGLWLFVLAAAITHVSFLQYWAYAAFGVSVIVHGIGSSLLLSRV
jgi:hypothetical protein